MAFARKVPVTKINENGGSLLVFGDLFQYLLNMFISIADRDVVIHIIFDIYKSHSVKDGTRKKRGKGLGMNVAISSFEQRLPAELNKFWSSIYKARFQQSFIQWVVENFNGGQKIVLGGGSKENENECLVISNKITRKMHSLETTLEEAYDKIMMHIEHEVNEGAKSIIIASNDTDILVCLLYHSIGWMKKGLNQVWNVQGPKSNRKFYPLHTLVSVLGEEIVLQLPAAHSLTGCDTVSKVGTKYAALKSLPSIYLKTFYHRTI